MDTIQKAIADFFAQETAQDISFTVERPADMSHGDYTTNAALVAAKLLGKNTRELADSLAAHLAHVCGKNKVSSVVVAGPGFVNITLAHEVIAQKMEEASAPRKSAQGGSALGGKEWGRGSANTDQRIMVEYANPNPFKEMHIGHMLNTIIGEAEARLLENSGATVIRNTYQGDVGPHVAKAMYGLQKEGKDDPLTAKEIGDAYAAGARAYEESPDVKNKIDILNQEIYAGTDQKIMTLWRKGREVSLAAFERLYKILGTHFDYNFFESETAESGARIVRDGIAKGIFEESEGAVIYRGEKVGLHTLVFITSRGIPTYEAKDIGLAFLKEERCESDRVIIVTAAEQIGHFKVLLAALGEIAPLLAKKTMHIPHGFLRLTSGKMSSREGNVITAETLIRNIILKASKKNSKKNEDPLIAEQVAIGAIKYMILRQSPGSDIIFDEDKSLSLDGDSGPYLQYALVRACSILLKTESTSYNLLPTTYNLPSTTYNLQPITSSLQPNSHKLERIIIHFPEVTARAAREFAPNLLVTYLTELAGAFNSFYAQERIIGGEHEAYKLLIVRAFVTTMSNGLNLLGIPTPQRM